MKQRTSVDAIDIKRNITNEIVREDIKEARKDFTDLMVEYWDSNLNVLFTRKKDIRVAAAIALDAGGGMRREESSGKELSLIHIVL